MKFITVRDIRTRPAQIWKMLPEEQEMILTNNGKPFALITPLDESDLEQTLSSVRKARAESAVRQMQIASRKKSITIEDIDNEINESREDGHLS
jgi:antitoxin (DNA-binding transcriptional repressor) of toxin-antitoxin stability system